MTYLRLSSSDSNVAKCVVFADRSWTDGIQPRCLALSSFIDLMITNYSRERSSGE